MHPFPTTDDRWTVTAEKLRQAVERIVELSAPQRVILFGSRARGEQRPDSDADLLVIESEVPDQAAEMTRLRRAIRSLRIPVDVLVVSEDKFRYWADTPGNVFYEAAREGQLLYEAA
jgi:predicted nucleotidyltransferase